MFYDLEEFMTRFISTSGNIGLITFEKKHVQMSFVNRVKRVLPTVQGHTKYKFVQIDASKLSADEFSKEIVMNSNVPDYQKIILAMMNLEPLLPLGGTILNGYRGCLTQMTGVIIMLRSNSLQNFLKAAPDIANLIGSYLASAEQMAEPISEDEVYMNESSN